MANFNVTINLSTSGATVTQNVNVGDTITVTVNTNNSNAGWTRSAITNATSNVTSGSTGGTCVVTPSSSGNYSISFSSSYTSGKTTTTTTGTVSGSAAAASDNTPENYSNLAGNKTSAALSTTYYATFSTTVPGTSSPGTGFSIGTQVSSGTAISVASGEYRINSGSWTSSSGTVNQNDTVYYRRTSSASYSTGVTGSLTIGDTTRTFTITTGSAPAADTEVDSLSFGADVTGAELGAVTYRYDQITGIDTAVTFAKSSGDAGFEWQVTSSTTQPTSGWGTSSVSVSNNQYVHLKMTASSSYSTSRTATFTIGSPAKTDTISTTTKAAPSPTAFDLGDTTGTTANSGYTSNTITIAGLDSGQSVTVSASSDSSNWQYYKNGTAVTNNANTTAVNGNTFYVSHVTKTGNSTVTSTSLTAGGTSDTFTTTNSNTSSGWSTNKTSPSGTPDEGDTIYMQVNAPTSLGAGANFYWSVSPTDVAASTGSGTTTYTAPTKGVPIATNIGAFNWQPTIDYTDDDAAGTGPYNYTVNVYSDSNRTVLVATATVAVNDTSQPLPPDVAINAIGNQTLAYAAGSDNGHSVAIVNGETHTTYASVVNGTTTELGTVQGAGASTATLSVADDNIAPGNQTTFKILARRTVANNGDNSQYSTDPARTYTISRRAQTPSISAALASDPNDDDVTINWTISNGDGGTLQYSTDNANWTNGTSFAQSAKRGTAYTLYARTNATVVSTTASASFTPPYQSPDSSISAIGNQNVAYNDTDAVVAIANGSSIDEYYVYNDAGTVSYGGRTGNGNITITHNVAAGGSGTFRVYARRPVAVGGNNTFVNTGTTFTIKMYPNSPAISVTDNNAAAASVTVTVSSTGGEGGTVYYAVTSYSTTTTYTQNRNTTVTYYAKSVGANGLESAVDYEDYYVGYIAPDAAISAIGNQNVAYNDTDAVVAIANGNASEEYYVYDSTGTTSYGGRTGNGNITITHGVAAGATGSFKVYVRRPVNIGGDNAFDATNATFSISMYPQTPSVTISFNNPDDNDVTATVTAGNGAGANTITYSNDNSTYAATNTFAAVRGTSFTGYVKNTGANGLTAVNSASATPGYNAPDAAISAITSPDQAYGTTTYTVPIANGSAIDEYYVYNDAGTVSYGGRTGNGNIVITHGVAAGGAATFRVYARRPIAVGGDNLFDDTGTTFEVEVYPNAPTLSITDNDAAGASVTVTLSSTGGEGGTVKYAVTSYSTTTTYTQSRGTTVTYYARSEGANGLISGVDFEDYDVYPETPTISIAFDNPDDNDVTATVTAGNSGGAATIQYSNDGSTFGTTNTFAAVRGTSATYYVRNIGTNTSLTRTTGAAATPGYNAPDSAIDSIISPDQDYGTTTYTVPIGNGNAIDEYYVYNNAGTVSYGGRTGNGDIIITHGVGAGQAATFRVYARRPVAVGGSNSFVNTTRTFEVEVRPQTPTGITGFVDQGTEATTGTFTVTYGGTTGANTQTVSLNSDYTTGAVTNGNNLTNVVRSGDRIYCRNTGANGLVAQAYFDTNATYLGATTTGYTFDATPDPQAYGSSAPAISFTSAKANHTVAIFEGTTIRSAALTGTTDYNNVGTNADVAAGGSRTYNLKTKRNEAGGGDPNAGYSDTDAGTTTVREYPQTPTGVTLTDPGTEAASAAFTITVTGTGGANTSIASLSSDYSSPATSGSGTLTLARSGTTVYLKNTGANSLTGTATVTSPETYLAVDNTISVSPSSQTLSQGDTSFNITISSIDANKGMYYQVRDSSGTIHEEGTPATNATSVTITVTDTPAASPETYTIFSKRLASTGGSNSYATSGTTFTATPFGGTTDSAPVISSISQADGANTNVKNITVNLSSTGSGGTALEYARSTSNTIPSSGWQTSATFNSLSVGTTYYFWASRNRNTSLFSSSVSYTPNNAQYGVIIRNTSGQSIVDTRSDKQSTAIKAGNITLAGVTVTIASGSTYIIRASGSNSTSFGAANNNIGTIFTATSSGTLSGGNVGKFQEITGVTGMTSTNSDEVGIIVQTENSFGITSMYSIHRDSGKFSFAPKYASSINLAYIVVRY